MSSFSIMPPGAVKKLTSCCKVARGRAKPAANEAIAMPIRRSPTSKAKTELVAAATGTARFRSRRLGYIDGNPAGLSRCRTDPERTYLNLNASNIRIARQLALDRSGVFTGRLLLDVANVQVRASRSLCAQTQLRRITCNVINVENPLAKPIIQYCLFAGINLRINLIIDQRIKVTLFNAKHCVSNCFCHRYIVGNVTDIGTACYRRCAGHICRIQRVVAAALELAFQSLLKVNVISCDFALGAVDIVLVNCLNYAVSTA